MQELTQEAEQKLTREPEKAFETKQELDVTVVLPAKNEGKNLPTLLKEIANAVSPKRTEIVIVDDGSSDDTLISIENIAKTLPVICRVIVHPTSCGQSTSVYHGVLEAKGKWIVTLDADGQNDPADIPKLIDKAQHTCTPHFCIIGHRQKRKDSAWKKFQSRIANNVRQWILNDNTPDTGCGLKLLPRSTFLLLPYFDHMHRYIPALTKRLGGDVVCVPVNHRPRTEGVSNYTAWNRGWAGLIDMMGVRWLMYRTKLDNILDGYSSEK